MRSDRRVGRRYATFPDVIHSRRVAAGLAGLEYADWRVVGGVRRRVNKCQEERGETPLNERDGLCRRGDEEQIWAGRTAN